MHNKNSEKFKIFVGYFKKHPLFYSDIFQPILTSDIDFESNQIIKDNTGDNISHKNKNYAELTSHYWVWKNYIENSKEEYIGFCHYRRFLDFNLSTNIDYPFFPIEAKKFDKIFQRYTHENIYNKIKGFDIILPYKTSLDSDILTQYAQNHPVQDMAIAIEVIKETFPDYLLPTLQFLASDKLYSCLHFIMKKELLAEYFEWMFKFLDEIEKRTNWSEYTEYMQVRTPAFLAERFFNVWLIKKISDKKDLKILETSSYILHGANYGPTILDLIKEQKNALNNK